MEYAFLYEKINDRIKVIKTQKFEIVNDQK